MTQPPSCKDCTKDISEMELHAEIEHLKRHLAERDAHIEAMETEFLKGNARITELEEQIALWREKYDRLYDSHRRVQRLNQNLEDKLLQMVDKCAEDKSQLTRDVETLSVRLAESNYTIGHLHKENERYKNDMNLAIQLLQCKPDNFVSQKFDSLPAETQARVSSYIMSKAKLNQESNQLSYNANTKNTSEKVNPDDFEFNISASLMSKILEESIQTNTLSGHCDTCTCLKKSINPFSMDENRYSVATQTVLRYESTTSLCFHCNSDINAIKAGLINKCNSPLSPKSPIENTDLLQMDEKDNLNLSYMMPQSTLSKNILNDRFSRNIELNMQTSKVKNIEDNSKLINFKQREIINKIGDELKEINIKDRYSMPSIEPMTGHHRLCDRTKSTNTSYTSDRKFEIDSDLNKNIKPIVHTTGINNSQNPSSADLTFSQIENSIPIPNISAEIKSELPIIKNELSSLNSKKNFKDSSISSNDAESKASSNKSYRNKSLNGSNPKVHIGPGPRFCSLIMQAGSKNVLLDNAQPNIAPVLYTRQSRNLENGISLTYNNDLDIVDKHNTCQGIDYNCSEDNINKSNIQNIINVDILNTVDNILDMPNEDLLIRDPMELSEKPESGYKSNESAEIIDKLLFGTENIIPENEENNKHQCSIQSNFNDCDIKNNDLVQYDLFSNKNVSTSEDNKISISQIENPLMDDKLLTDNLKIFNFDNYEKNFKQSSTLKPSDNLFSMMSSNVINSEQIKNPTESTNFIDEGTELLNSNFDLKIASKNLSEINKKYTIPNTGLPETLLPEIQKNKDWQRGDTYTEKSSSSLSSDDSAAVLQKQQLIRVAEWVQKNLEMDQHTDFENSDSCHQSIEEMHHVRNDFPRPAKIDHRIRKNNLKLNHKGSHHLIKHSANLKNIDLLLDNNSNNIDEQTEPDFSLNSIHTEKKINQNTDITSERVLEEVENDHAIKDKTLKHAYEKSISENTDVNTVSSSKTYTKQELARMEYNVKQFLLNGTKWTRIHLSDYSKARRTSSKTETDL